MSIPAGIRTPGVYQEINLNAQRSGLPLVNHKVLILTGDTPLDSLAAPVQIYDKASADAVFGEGSVAGQMITAAVKTNRFVQVDGYTLGEIYAPQ